MDIEWLLSTLFDASLLSPSSRRQRRLFFCSVSGHTCPDGYHYVNIAAERLDRFAPTRSYQDRVGVRRISMKERSADEAAPIYFGEKLASSQAFAGLFRDGMALVEETAAYLDGPGRQESKKLERSAALAYATESMRLTTRLMQLASWLLLHRAVKEGEMTLIPGQQGKVQGQARRRRAGRSGHHQAFARAAARPDRPFQEAQRSGSPSRRQHLRAAAGAG